LDPAIKKTRWSREEELALLESVRRRGTNAWSRVAVDLFERGIRQCRCRYKLLERIAKEAQRPIMPIAPPQAVLDAEEARMGGVVQ
jgi:hypothetical protein